MFTSVLSPLLFAGALTATLGVSTTPPDTTGADDTELTPFEQSLDRVPASALAAAETAVVYYIDMELAWQRAGAGTDVDERLEQIGSLAELPTWTQIPQLFGPFFAQLDEARAEVGFTMFDVDREITVEAPPHNVTIAETRVEPEEIAAALESDPLWSSELSMVEHADGGYFQWGDDPTAPDPDLRSPMRPLGQGGQLALVGSDADATVVRTVDAADMEAVLSTLAGHSDSLMDSDLFAAALPALVDREVVQLMAIDEAFIFDPVWLGLDPEQFEALLAEMVLLEPYDGVVIAEQYDGAEYETKVLLVHGDEADAETNAVLAEQALADSVDPVRQEALADVLPGAMVSVVGSVVVVTLPFEGAYPIAQQMLTQRSLFPAG
jgi:hypothetical protein